MSVFFYWFFKGIGSEKHLDRSFSLSSDFTYAVSPDAKTITVPGAAVKYRSGRYSGCESNLIV